MAAAQPAPARRRLKQKALPLNQDSHFGTLNNSSIHSTGSITTAILQPNRQRTIWQPGV
jgi:hypothetical protein